MGLMSPGRPKSPKHILSSSPNPSHPDKASTGKTPACAGEKTMALHCLSSSSSCFSLSQRLKSLSVSCSANKSLTFASNVAVALPPRGGMSVKALEKENSRRGMSVVCMAAVTKKADSAVKRARQAEKRRLYNKAKKSEMRTRMKKVLEALDELKKKAGAQLDELVPIEKLIAEAYSSIDKAVKSGSLHRNTGARRKSRLARRKKTVEIHHGWYTPAPTPLSA